MCKIIAGGSTKRHLYWCMKNCSECPIQLRASIMNISKHYQVYTVTKMHANIQILCTYFSHRMNTPTAIKTPPAIIRPIVPVGFFSLTLMWLMCMRKRWGTLWSTVTLSTTVGYVHVYVHTFYFCSHVLLYTFFSVVTRFGWSHSTTSCWHTSQSVSISTQTHSECEWTML